MDLNVKGDPGSGNTYQQTDIQSVGSYNPAATTSITHIHQDNRSTRMGAYFEKLQQEILANVTSDMIDELRNYTTKLDGTKGLEEKLVDGGFSRSRIDEACRLKEMYAKRASKYDCYPSAQQINIDLFARIKHEFNTFILPMIEDGEHVRRVMQEIRKQIVIPIRDLLDTCGANDDYLHYTEDHIYGMIYYLTGMCHLNWTDYDNI